MLALIVARSINNVIGKAGAIPWNIAGEKEQFKKLTTGNVVVMGRKTYEEIGHPLPNRKTIVVSKSRTFEGENLKSAASVKDALSLAATWAENKNIYFAGGYEIYKEALPLVHLMYITEVKIIVEDGDVFFPDFNPDDFDFALEESGGEEIKYCRTKYTRKKKSYSALE